MDFCGSKVKVKKCEKDSHGFTNAKFSFKKFNNGENGEINYSCHPNILKAVITGKKSWGLFKNEWSQGISEWSFTIDEIIKSFDDENITIPKSLLDDFKNSIEKHKIERNDKYLKQIYGTHRTNN